MRKGFLLGSSSVPSRPAVARSLMTLTATTLASKPPPVDNLISAATVNRRLEHGAKPLRVECDFVTCSQ